MKLRSLRYLLCEGFKNIWINRLMSVASIGVLVACMLLMGAATLFSLNVDKALGTLQDQNVVLVYTADSATEKEARAAYDAISKLDNVKTAKFITKEQGMDELMKDMGDQYEELFNVLDKEDSRGEFLPYGVQVSFNDLEQYADTIRQIKQIKGVDHINDSSEMTAQIVSIRRTVTIAGVAIIALLMITALVIIANTIRITMNSRKLEISIMKAVGATNSFIRIPFIVEGMVFGIISALLTTVILYFAYNFIIGQPNMAGLHAVEFMSVAGYMFGAFCIMGILAGCVGSMFSIGKYLRKEGSEFRAF
ncbi:MAG: permease-like cell division protein FtsX [Acutalibacteraceae bacterium]